MGYWGYLVAAKSDVPLDTFPELSTFGDDYVRLEALNDGWQRAWVAGANENPAIGAQLLAAATGHPVLAAFVLDSDCGPVAAATPTGDTWSGTLAKSTAVDSYEMPNDGITPETAATSFTHWAEAAALPTDPDLLAQALDPGAKDPERLFVVLLQSAGINRLASS